VIPRSRAAAQDAAHSTVEITCEMIEAAALVLECRFDSSQGIAAIVAADLLRAALCRRSEGQRSAAADLREQGIPRLFDLTHSSLRLLYQPELSHQDDAVSALLAAPKAPEH
jgi:hypothetical protein